MRISALIKRILLQIIRDKRTLALLFIGPLLILTLMDLVFNGQTVNPELGIENGNEKLVEVLEERDLVVREYDEIGNIEDKLLEDGIDGFLQIKENDYTLILLNDDPSIAKNLEMKVKQVLGQQRQLQLNGIDGTNQVIEGEHQPEDFIKTTYIYGDEDSVLFDKFSPMLIGFFVFFFVFLVAGIGLLNERTTGTLERLLATPIRRGEIVTGYLIGYGIIALLQTIVIVLFAIHVLDIVLIGSIWDVMVINIIVALVALSLGILLSTFASSEFQMVQFIPVVIIPQIFFSGIFSLEAMADWLQVFAKFMPLYYAADALNGVMYRGLTLIDFRANLLILIAFAIVFIILNLFTLKRYRKL